MKIRCPICRTDGDKRCPNPLCEVATIERVDGWPESARDHAGRLVYSRRSNTARTESGGPQRAEFHDKHRRMSTPAEVVSVVMP